MQWVNRSDRPTYLNARITNQIEMISTTGRIRSRSIRLLASGVRLTTSLSQAAYNPKRLPRPKKSAGAGPPP